MSDPDTGDFEGLAPQEALDADERLDNDDDSVDPPDRWHGADQFGTTPAEEAAGAPLDIRLAEERPEEEPVEVPDRPVAETPIDELDESVDEVAYAQQADASPDVPDAAFDPVAVGNSHGVDDAFGNADEPERRGAAGGFPGIDEAGGLHVVSDSDTRGNSVN